MDMITQIGGIKQSRISTIKRALEKQHIAVADLNSDEFVFSQGNNWSQYEVEVAFFEAIARSTFHVISNDDGLVNERLSLQILQAILNNKPIIISELPTFGDDVDLFTQRVIISRMHLFAVSNLARQRKQESQAVMRHVKNTKLDYFLSERDTMLANAKIRNYLQRLLTTQSAQNTQVA